MVSYVTCLYETCSCGKCVVVEYPLKLVAAYEEHMISSIIHSCPQYKNWFRLLAGMLVMMSLFGRSHVKDVMAQCCMRGASV